MWQHLLFPFCDMCKSADVKNNVTQLDINTLLGDPYNVLGTWII